MEIPSSGPCNILTQIFQLVVSPDKTQAESAGKEIYSGSSTKSVTTIQRKGGDETPISLSKLEVW